MTGEAATTRTVLVMDDDEALRRTVRRILELYDYVVLEAEDARAAFALADSHEGPIHLMICDLVLPGLGGREAANTLLARRPEARLMYMSGFRSPDSFRKELEEGGVEFLGKPFEVPELLAAVERVLA